VTFIASLRFEVVSCENKREAKDGAFPFSLGVSLAMLFFIVLFVFIQPKKNQKKNGE